MSAMIRTDDPRVARIMAEKSAQEQAKKSGRVYRAINVGRPSFADRFPDGAWTGHPCFIIGGGPSLKGFDFSRLRGERVIAINKAFYDAPFADIMFGMDRPLLDWIMEGKLGENFRQAFADFAGVKLWLDLSGYSYPPGVYSVPAAGEIGWTTSLKEGLYHGQNSGYGALNLAIVLGANPIYLLGYDCKKGEDGSKNYHNGYPSGSNPDAMNIFKQEIEAGVRLLRGGPKIVNLNPQSALRCFSFGDIDQVLPKAPATGDRITIITPTGDRPLAFRLCQEWVKNQTMAPSQWVIIDDGAAPMNVEYRGHSPATPGAPVVQYVRREPRADDPKVTLDLNMREALPLITGDKILIMEDDEYYAPRYIEEMAKRLDSYDVVGICDSKYYHLPTGNYDNCKNMLHASLAQTGFRSSFLSCFSEFVGKGIYPDWLDTQIWRYVQISKKTSSPIPFLLFIDSSKSLYVGMKGLPGRLGIGAGHNPKTYQRHRGDSVSREQLKKWIPQDYQIYLDVLSGKLTESNYKSYFGWDNGPK